MDRSLFLARLMGPTFVAIALGMLINLGMYESMIAEALHTGIVLYLSGLGHRYRQSAQYVARGLARDHHGYGLADDHWRHHPHRLAAVRCCGRLDHLWRTHLYYRGGADSWCAGRLPEFQGIRAARLRRGKAMTFELRMLALSVVLGRTSRACLACRERATRLSLHRRSTRRGRAPLTGIAGRLERALRNFVETFPLLASAVLIAYVANTHKSDKDPRTTAGKSPLDVLFETNSFAATE